MRTTHDIDVVILLATMRSSKRRPAELVAIVAAAELIQNPLPSPENLGDAIRRLSTLGMITATTDGYTLTALGQETIAKQDKKVGSEELIAAIKSDLGAYRPRGESLPIILSAEQLSAAIRTHKLARKAAGKNLLMPRPKVDRYFKVEGRWRRVPATR